MRQTTFQKGAIPEKKWYIIDAKDAVLGRIASRIAIKLLGKDNPNYLTYQNFGSAIVVINAKHVKVTGKKLDKPFFWHTGFAGGIKERTIAERLASKTPEKVLMKAVERMVGSGPLARERMKNLRIFAEEKHCHAGQNPEKWDLSSEHPMNKKER